MDEEEYNDTEELIERFRRSMSLPIAERYFDEDELIDIFDSAGDIDDDLLRLEVLSVASRFYPDSDDLNQRRCLFYGIISENAGREYLESNAGKKGQMWELLRIRNKRSMPDTDFPKEFDRYLSSVKKFNDEEVVIQFIRLVADVNAAQWLKDNLEEIKKKCSNKNVVLFEAATAFETMHCYDLSAELLVTLTEVDPFGYSNWLMLAEQYLALGKDSEFNNAIDYALALSPDYWQGLYVKAKYCYDKGDYEESRKLLEKCCVNDPTTVDAYRLYACALQKCGQDGLAEHILKTALDLFPADVLNIIPDLLPYFPEDFDDIMDVFYRNNPDNSEAFWRSWSDRLWEAGFPDIAVGVANCYLRNTGEYPMTLIVAQYYFKKNIHHVETLMWLKAYVTGMLKSGEQVDYLTVYIIYIVTFGRLGHFDKAAENLGWLRKILALSVSSWSVTQNLAIAEAGRFAAKVERLLASSPAPDDFTDLSRFGL